jgi:hypothetical protein
LVATEGGFVGAKAPVHESTLYDRIVLFPVKTYACAGFDDGTQ